MAAAPPDPRAERAPDDALYRARERELLAERLDRVAAEKRLALQDPGSSWREWLYYTAFKWWLGIALLIVDSMIAAQWLELGSYGMISPSEEYVGLGLSLALAVLAEVVLYRALWYRPPHDYRRDPRGFRRTLFRPVEYGRWTPERDAIRAGGSVPGASGPQPKDFL